MTSCKKLSNPSMERRQTGISVYSKDISLMPVLILHFQVEEALALKKTDSISSLLHKY